MKTLPVALTIAGSDSGGGAGIQADLHTFARLGVWGTSALTCLTAQTPDRVTRVEPATPEMVAEQVRVVVGRFPVRAIKIGMTYSAEIIEAVAGVLAREARGIPVVLDPVMRATSGASLLGAEGEAALMRRLLGLATIVTPNLSEASVLAEMGTISDVAGMEEAARRIQIRTPGAVLVKGGHLDRRATDVLLVDGVFTHLTSQRVQTPFTHGTGCSLSSAIAAGLARGLRLSEATRAAKRYVTGLLRSSVCLGDEGLGGLGFVGRGRPPFTPRQR
jgi:hydroxymethylpyrimidine/phosphomethylpyrimidine kinase